MNNQAAAKSKNAELISASGQGVIVSSWYLTTTKQTIPLILYAKMKNTSEKDIDLDKSQISNIYYVYAKGGLDGIYTDPATGNCIACRSLGGVVLNRAQQYVWERGNIKTKMQMDTEGIPESVIRSGSWDKDVLKKSLKNSGTVIDLSGCSLDSVLYEISAQRAVIAKTGADSSVVIVGYDEYNTWLSDPVQQRSSPYGMNDSTAFSRKQEMCLFPILITVNY